jgi:hypothetical protein
MTVKLKHHMNFHVTLLILLNGYSDPVDAHYTISDIGMI